MYFLEFNKKTIKIKKIDPTNGTIMGAFDSKKEAILNSLKIVQNKLDTILNKPPKHFLIKSKFEQCEIKKELEFFEKKLTKMLSSCK